MSNETQEHNLAAIRQLLLAAFTPAELSPEDLERYQKHGTE